MDTARFLRLREIFDSALLLPAPERDSFIARACSGDTALEAEVRELWAAHLAATAESGRRDAPPPSEPMVGPYRLKGRLGEGGMGAVYLAVRDDGAFRKQVALKVLRNDQVSPELIHRFHQERQVLANLDHPNIARILDGGQTAAGLPYYVMEYVDGLPLDRFCDDRKIDVSGRVRIFQQVCHAVHYLHEHLVVHRDLKPSNILVTGDGAVKLLDFGIAKLQIPAAGDVTVPCNRLMTPGYASPEQLSGAPITRSSDIYSLGCVLYQLLTGALPYRDPAAKLHTDAPPPRILGDLDNIALKCLHRDPRERYDTARELAGDLQRFLEGRTVLARPGHVTERAVKFVKRNRLAVAVCTFVLFLGAFGAWQALEAKIQTHRAAERETQIAHLLDELNHASARTAPAASRARDVRRLREALQSQAATSPQRDDLLNRGLQALDALRPYAAQDPALARELVAAYQALGSLSASSSPALSMAAAQSAAALSAAPQPVDSAPPPPHPIVRTQPRPALPSPPVADAAQPPAASAIQPEAPPVDPAEQEKLASRLADVTARSAAVEDGYRQLSDNSRRLGQIVHPDITAAYTRMKLALDQAQKDLDAGRLDSARKNLDIADTWANRVLTASGR
ncbi:MAG TPA: protein kinase [Verrucomicrobiae bacterium]|nr:protein kinase [Verrucomicrobiae bacterium]